MVNCVKEYFYSKELLKNIFNRKSCMNKKKYWKINTVLEINSKRHQKESLTNATVKEINVNMTFSKDKGASNNVDRSKTFFNLFIEFCLTKFLQNKSNSIY